MSDFRGLLKGLSLSYKTPGNGEKSKSRLHTAAINKKDLPELIYYEARQGQACMLSLGSERLKISKQRQTLGLLLPHSFRIYFLSQFCGWCHLICACILLPFNILT